MYLSFALKIAFSNFFSLRKKFLSICGICILIICLVALNTVIGVLRSSNRSDFVQLSSKMTFSAKKTQTHENLSSALQKTFNFIRKNHFSCT